MKNDKIKIVFMGTPEFGAIILEKLIKANFKPVLIITAPDKLVGRKQILTPPPVKIMAQRYDIPVLQPEKIEPRLFEKGRGEIENYKPELVVVAAFGQILPKEILDIPKYGSLNVHPSLLPKYRGASPVQSAILNGDKKTGATIMLMDEKIDHGPILAQRELESPISNFQFPKLHDKLAELGANLLIKIIPKWIKGEIKPKPQNELKATYTKILKKQDGKISWKKSAEYIERQIRAFYPWPGSYTFWEKDGKLTKIKILNSRVYKSPTSITYSIGKVLVVPQNEIGVQCGKGFSDEKGDFLVIERLQMEGKKEMASEEFIRGHLNFIGTILK